MNINTIMENQFALIAKNPNITRSPKMTLEIHTSIKELCQKTLGDGYEVVCQDTREYVHTGSFLDKKVDIAILKDEKLVGAIEVKAIRSSYKKNATNYFYNMLGETLNLKESGVKVCQLIVIPEVVKFKEAGRVKEEVICDTQIEKYVKLEKSDCFSKPDQLIVSMVSMDYENNKCSKPTLSNFELEDVKEFLTKNIDTKERIQEFLKLLTQ